MTQALKVHQLPVLEDNYIYILWDKKTGTTAVVDPALAQPVKDFLKEKNFKLNFILNTHHHLDHVGGNLSLKQSFSCRVMGFSEDAHRIPGIEQKVKAGEEFFLGECPFRILFFPGHTLGHIAYWFFRQKKLFIGDTLFAMGCGRLFEGSYKQMFESLQQIKALPLDTEIFCAHEYTEKNGSFALSLEPQNLHLLHRMQKVRKKRQKQEPTVPFFLFEELKTNPFLKAKSLEEFKLLRKKRDKF